MRHLSVLGRLESAPLTAPPELAPRGPFHGGPGPRGVLTSLALMSGRWESALYGRAELVGRLRTLLAGALEGRGSLALLRGEPGIGKSRLAEQVASDAAASGAAVAWGRAWEAGGAPAYWPWTQLFRNLGLPEDPFVGAASDADAGAAEQRFACFERAARALTELARERPLVLVLDDLHAADTPSLLLLLLLARQLRRSRLLVLGAYRDAQLARAPELGVLLAKLEREGEVFALEPLGLEEVAAWLAQVWPGASAAQAEELYGWTEGHPLFVAETLRLRSSGAPPLDRPPRLCGLLDDRLALLSREARPQLQAAAVLGRHFSLSDLASLLGGSADVAAQALREALAASILATDGSDAFRFAHVLLRDRLYNELSPSQRAELHARAGERLAARGAELGVVVHHFFAGKDAARAERVAEVALAAANESLSRLAFEAAVSVGRRALDGALAAQLEPRLASELRLVVAEGLMRLERTLEGRALVAEAAALAEGAAEHELLARAALVYGTELATGSPDEKLRSLLRRALGRLAPQDSTLRARLLARLAAALTPPHTPAELAELRELMRSALAMARRLEEPHTLLYVLQFAATVALLVPEPERFAHLSETVELAGALDQRLVLLLALPGFVTALLARGELSRALGELERYDRLLEEFPQPRHRIRRWLIDSLLAALRGDFAQMERCSREAQQLVQRNGAGPERNLWLIHRFALARLFERPELLDEGEAVLALFETVPRDRPFRACVLVALGRPAEAAEVLREADVAAFEPHSPHLFAAAEACALLGDAALAQQLYPRLSGCADALRWIVPGGVIGMTERALGDLARLLGRGAEAVRHYDQALASCEELGCAPLAELCRQRREQASELLAAASSTASAPAVAAGAPAASAAAALATLQREGEVWSLTSPSGSTLRFKHAKGFEYLRSLLDSPGHALHVAVLAGAEVATGDAGVVLDERAKAEYRRRLEELRDIRAEAERFADLGRAERAAREIEALAAQLAAAVGLGGRDRRAASDVERLRINVQRRLKDAVERIERADATLGRYLARAIKTGTHCSYVPL